MSTPTHISPTDQSATFIELFFDLVFVFSVTQVVGLLHDGITWSTVAQGVLVFWLVWWAWTQFTWALNAADTTHTWIELGTLTATAVAFFMAVALPDAFHERALWFAVPYVLVRLIGLRIYNWVASADASQRAAVRTFSLLSLSGMAAVLVGALVGGSGQLWLWGLAIVFDLITVGLSGRSDAWGLHPDHFAERHGLFVIIALGETLIVAASGVTGATWTGGLFGVAVLAVAIACSFWWSYFVRIKDACEAALGRLTGSARTEAARDAYSLIHFLMLCGVIAFAIAIEEAVAHPGDPLPLVGRLALALGVLLYVGGVGAALARTTGRLPLPRTLIALLTAAAIVVIAGVAPTLSLAIAFVGVVAVAVIEERSGHVITT
jgi:low temperature requirement protein LtrA